MTNKKKVILVWTQNCCNLKRDKFNNYWGLGDIIRGTIKVYQLSKKMNFEFIVNINLHPISLFLKPRTSEYDKLIIKNKNNINFILPSQTENYILNSQDEILYFLTNDHCDINSIDDECKNFIKDILTPNDEMNKLLREQNINYYDIIHLRLGDVNIQSDAELNDEFFNKIKNTIMTNLNNNFNILMCDSLNFKKKLIKNNNFNKDKLEIFDLEIGHVGYEENTEKIKNSMFEFFIISKSNSIKTYSVYPWISGFVYWISIIYDIPLINIK